MSSRDQNRLDFLALKIKSGVPLTPEEQAQWDRDALLGDRIAAGLPLTEAEREKLDRAKDARQTVRNGILWVEAPPITVDDWKRAVAESRGQRTTLVDETQHNKKS